MQAQCTRQAEPAQPTGSHVIAGRNTSTDRPRVSPGGHSLEVGNGGVEGFCVPVGPTALLVLQPKGKGVAAETIASGGPRVLGVSFGARNLGRAQRWVERGHERKLTTYRGLSGESFLAPTRGDLGLSIEFHALSPRRAACAGAMEDPDVKVRRADRSFRP